MAEAERWIWLGGSFLLSVIITQAAWRLRRWERGEARLASLARSPLFPPLLQAARFLYYIGLPFAALVWGQDAVVGRLLGLQPLPALPTEHPSVDLAARWADWAGDVAWAVGLGLAAWAVLAAGWRTVGGVVGGPPKGSDASPWTLLREAVFQEAHWVFYRNAPIVVLGTYWGTWAGLGLVALEAAINPWWRARLQDPTRALATLVQVGLAVLSSALYLKTANLWLMIPVHWGVAWGLAAWARRR